MPSVKRSKLPRSLLHRLYQRAIERGASTNDIIRMAAWLNSNAQVPDGPWWKNFGSFKLCGDGELPKTFLAPHQSAYGEEIA